MEQWNIPSLDWEEWRDIPRYEWYYMVSNMGRVVSLHYWKYRILKYCKNHSWYRKVNLKWFSMLIHRLVAQAFLWLNLYTKHDYKHWICVCHINDIRDDNRLENLFLGTRLDNIRDMFSKWRQQKFLKWKEHRLYWKPGWLAWKYWKDNPLSKSVVQIDDKWIILKRYDSIANASLETWIVKSSIWMCCRWKLKKDWWYKWEFYVKDIIKD